MKKGKDLQPHIGIYGRRNTGKSSLINALVGQSVAIVADYPGTTTDPVKKSVEIFGIGPVVIIDTAGIDDEGTIGNMRIEKTLHTLPLVDAAIILTSDNIFGEYEMQLIEQLQKLEVPYCVVHNKSDIMMPDDNFERAVYDFCNQKPLFISVTKRTGIENVIEKLREIIPENIYTVENLFDGLLNAGQVVLLVTPIDAEAPVGRMILPQVMAWRHALDLDAVCMSVKPEQLNDFVKLNIHPHLVVTDSQVFDIVASTFDEQIPLTSFSILFARFRGDFETFVKDTPTIEQLKDGDKILIIEACTHEVNCDDIGRYKIPRWLVEKTGNTLHFDWITGQQPLPQDMNKYALAIHCGGCMITRRQQLQRIRLLKAHGVPVTNYGMTIAYLKGIFHRAIKPFNLNRNA